jgi:hypothetical protein
LGWNTGHSVDECQVEAQEEVLELHGKGTVPIGSRREDRGLLTSRVCKERGEEIVRAIFGVSETRLQENILHVKINGLEYYMLVKKRETIKST